MNNEQFFKNEREIFNDDKYLILFSLFIVPRSLSHEKLFIRLLIIFHCSLFIIHCEAQSRPPEGVGGNSGTYTREQQAVDSTQEEAVALDTAYITSFLPTNRGKITLEDDSLLTRNFQQYDPIRQRDNDYTNLGQIATAARPILYRPRVHRGFDVGIHSFDIYHIKNDELRFYRQTKPFADLFYSGSSQENGVFNARFGRSFSDNINLSIDYRRDFNLNINNQPSVRGRLYDIPRARTVAFGVGLWYYNDRYDGFLTFASNFASQTDKGGIASDSIFNTLPTNSFSTADARITNNNSNLVNSGAYSRIERYEISYRHFFTLNKNRSSELLDVSNEPKLDSSTKKFQNSKPKIDSTKLKVQSSKLSVRQYRIEHNISYKSDKYFSAHKFPLTDSTTYYQNVGFYDPAFVTDPRGVRFFISDNVISNDIRVGTVRNRSISSAALGNELKIDSSSKIQNSKSKTQNPIDSTTKIQNPKSKIQNSIQSDLFEIGISHEYHAIDQEATTRKVQNIIGVGRWLYTPNDNFRVDANASINFIGYNAGDYRLSGEIFYDLPKIGTLTLNAINQLYAPNFIQTELYVTDKIVWDNNSKFSKTLETHLSGTLTVPKFDLSATVSYTLLNNAVYFDTAAIAQQSTAPISILQAVIQKDFKVGIFHLDNRITLQKSSEKFIPVPAIYLKSGLYFETKIFKKAMLFRAGFDVRYTSSWYAPAYLPLTGQFFIQNKLSVPDVAVVDFYASMKVKTFRFFLKLENIASGITHKVYYPSYLYPVPDFSTQGATYLPLRFGIRWQLLN